MTTELTAEAAVGLARLDSEYWYRVDHPGKEGAADLYAPDGRMVFGKFRLDGRQAIERFFHDRNTRLPARTTRHISTNLGFERLDPCTMRVRSIVSVHAGLGDLPLPTGSPAAILDFDDICVRCADGWVYQERSGTAIFIGAGAAPFLTFQLPAGHPLRTEPAF